MNSIAIVLALVGGLPDAWFTEPILSPDVARDEVRRRVDAQLIPLPLAEGREVRDWEARRAAIRERKRAAPVEVRVAQKRGACWCRTAGAGVGHERQLSRFGFSTMRS